VDFRKLTQSLFISVPLKGMGSEKVQPKPVKQLEPEEAGPPTLTVAVPPEGSHSYNFFQLVADFRKLTQSFFISVLTKIKVSGQVQPQQLKQVQPEEAGSSTSTVAFGIEGWHSYNFLQLVADFRKLMQPLFISVLLNRFFTKNVWIHYFYFLNEFLFLCFQ
jgi:hypothetical protein